MKGFLLDVREFWTLCSVELRVNSLAMKSSREKRPFWYFLMAVGMAVAAAGVLAPGGDVRRYELAGGFAILMLSLLRLFFLRNRGRKRRRRHS
jgi:hypothetical protein